MPKHRPVARWSIGSGAIRLLTLQLDRRGRITGGAVKVTTTPKAVTILAPVGELRRISAERGQRRSTDLGDARSATTSRLFAWSIFRFSLFESKVVPCAVPVVRNAFTSAVVLARHPPYKHRRSRLTTTRPQRHANSQAAPVGKVAGKLVCVGLLHTLLRRAGSVSCKCPRVTSRQAVDTAPVTGSVKVATQLASAGKPPLLCGAALVLAMVHLGKVAMVSSPPLQSSFKPLPSTPVLVTQTFTVERPAMLGKEAMANDTELDGIVTVRLPFPSCWPNVRVTAPDKLATHAATEVENDHGLIRLQASSAVRATDRADLAQLSRRQGNGWRGRFRGCSRRCPGRSEGVGWSIRRRFRRRRRQRARVRSGGSGIGRRAGFRGRAARRICRITGVRRQPGWCLRRGQVAVGV